jgi:hypothetical protein
LGTEPTTIRALLKRWMQKLAPASLALTFHGSEFAATFHGKEFAVFNHLVFVAACDVTAMARWNEVAWRVVAWVPVDVINNQRTLMRAVPPTNRDATPMALVVSVAYLLV